MLTPVCAVRVTSTVVVPPAICVYVPLDKVPICKVLPTATVTLPALLKPPVVASVFPDINDSDEAFAFAARFAKP